MEAIRLLRDVDFEELDDSGFPVADMINQGEVAKWTLRRLNQTNIVDDDARTLLQLLDEGKNGLELKQALREAEKTVDNISELVIKKDDSIQDVSSLTPKVAEEKNIGGIDFNLDLLELEIQGQNRGFNQPNMDRSFEHIRIDDGLFPVIINIIPVTNLPVILGVAESNDEQSSNPYLAI